MTIDSTARRDAAKRPVSPLAGRYGHPVHPALVAVPIGAWIATCVFDVGSRFAPGAAALASGSRWLIAVGVLGALIAAPVGLLDLSGIPAGTAAFRTGLWHMSLNLLVTAAFAVNFLLRRGTGSPVPWPLIILSLAATAVLAVAGYLGGRLAYRYGVRVADEDTQALGYRLDRAGDASRPGTRHQPLEEEH